VPSSPDITIVEEIEARDLPRDYIQNGNTGLLALKRSAIEQIATIEIN
jgi:hypothetical protein